MGGIATWVVSTCLLVVVAVCAVDGDLSMLGRAADVALAQAATRRSKRSDDAKDLPTLDKLLDDAPKDGTAFTYAGCDILVEAAAGTVALNMKAASCKDIMSVPRVFKKLTNQDLDTWTRFAPMKKFNVDLIKLDTKSKDISIEASAKESFCFLRGTKMKVKEGELGMDFNFDEDFSFSQINIDVGGVIRIGDEKANFSLSKEKKDKKGVIDIQIPAIPLATFILQLAKLKTPKLADTTLSVLFASVKMNNPKITGQKMEDGMSEIVITGSAIDLPLLGPAVVHMIIKSEKGKAAEFCVIAKLTNVKPGALLGVLLKKKVKGGLDNVPMINDLELDMVLQFASADLGKPQDKEIVGILEEFTTTPGLWKGLTVSFVVPLHALLERVSVGGGYGEPVDQFDFTVTANIQQDKVMFDFGNSQIQLRYLLLAFVPKFNIEAYDKLFGKVTIMVDEFNFDYKSKIVALSFNATDVVSVNDGFLKIPDVKFKLARTEKGRWTFQMDGTIKIGDGELYLSMSKIGDKYSLAGCMDSLKINDMLDAFSLKNGTVGKVIDKIKPLNVQIKSLKLKADYNPDGNSDFRFNGQIDFYGYETIFEGYLSKTSGDRDETKLDFAFGIVVQDVCLGHLAGELFKSNKKATAFPKVEWISGIVVTIIVGKGEDGLKFDDKTIQAGLERISGGAKTGGAFLDALALLPDDCKGESICEFLKEKLGARAEIGLSGAISSDGFALQAIIRGDMKLSEKFTLKEVSLNMKIGGGDAEFYLEGMCAVEFETSTQEFRASVSMSATGNFQLAFSISGPIWSQAFGLKYLSVKGFSMKAGISAATLAPTFIMAGQLFFGSGKNQISAQLAGGFESSPTSPGFHLYAKFNKLSIGSILNAFEIDVDLPDALMDTGFPNGLVAGMSLPGSTYIEEFGLTVKAGFALKGKFVFLGLGMFCDIEINLPAKFKLAAKFDKISVGGGALELAGYGGEGGPSLLIELGAKNFKIEIDAHISILRIGVGAKINIDENGFHFIVVGQIAALFEVSLEVKAPYGKLGDMKSDEWMVKTCLGESVMDKVKMGAVDEVNDCHNVTSELKRRNSEVNGEANSWFEDILTDIQAEKMELAELEEKFQKEIDDLEESKEKLNKDCVAECVKEREWVGGFGMKVCKIGARRIECPYWIKHKTLRESPYCLSECESSKFSLKSWLSGLIDSGKLIGLEKEMKYKSQILDGFQNLLFSSKSLVEFAEIASHKVGQVADSVAEAAAAIKKFAVEHLFVLRKLCLTANLKVASNGFCFIVDADFTVGGQKGRRVILKNKEVCLNRKFAMTIGAEIAKEAFSGLKSLREQVKGVTSFFDKSDDKAQAVKENIGIAKTEKRSDCHKVPTKPCTVQGEPVAKLKEFRSDEYLYIPDIIVRNHESMVAMLNIYNMDEDDIKVEDDADAKDDIPDFALKYEYPLNIEPEVLKSSAEGFKCDRTRQVLDLYNGVSQSLKYLEGLNINAKKDYDGFMKEQEEKMKKLESKVLETTKGFKDPKDVEDATFYLNEAKKGMAEWKTNFDTRYVEVDHASLKNWRGYMAESIQEKGMDVASFVSVLDTAATESAQRAEIPTGGVQQSMAAVQQIIRSLLNNDDAPFSSKYTEIKNLSEQVDWLNKARATMSCFQDDE